MLRAEHQAGPEASSGRGLEILKPGRNCWRVARASRAAVLVDSATYFAALEDALQQATRSITIIGWDFDAAIRLRGETARDAPRLGDLLRRLVEERPALEVRILVWNLSVLHTPSASLPLVMGAPWQDHPRISLRLDTRHPLYGAQHQKIVAIDGCLAFVGGIDLTVQRWDASAHLPDDPRRVDPEGRRYEPVHDIQMVIEGEAAANACTLADRRWNAITGENVDTCVPHESVWPPGLEPDFEGVPVAIARTAPRQGVRRGVREIAALSLDALRAARETVYIEAQYFADRRVGRTLAELLERPHGPEVVVVAARAAHGILEAWIMDGNRKRVMRMLKRADRHGRLRLLHPVFATESGDREIFVHAKLLVVDDRLLRVGSSNLNRRSTGLDIECDLAIEAGDAATARRIAAVRARLLGEHLGVAPERLDAALAAEGSLIGAIDRLSGSASRCLRPFADVTRSGPTHLRFGTRLLDPRGPIRLADLFSRRSRAGVTEAMTAQPFRHLASESANTIAPSPSGSR